MASTKAFTQQVSMVLLAIYLGRRNGKLPQARARELVSELLQLPNKLKDVFDHGAQLQLWGSRVAPPHPGRNTFGALQILRELGVAQRGGRGPSGRQLAVVSRQTEADSEKLLERLRDAAWVTRTEAGEWMLSCRLDDIALRDVFARFSFSPRCVPADAMDDPLTSRLLALHEQAAERLSISLAELFAQ